MKKLFTFILLIFTASPLFGQFQMSAKIQNMHLWRGGEVADGFVLTTDLHYSFLDDNLRVGFWGGTNAVGEYKEFNYYASYSYGNFSVGFSDTYNFSSYATYNNEEFFNYNPRETGRFFDVTFRYRIGVKHPFLLSWSTVVFGRDRGEMNEGNLYSTFCSVEYEFYNRDGWLVDARIGGAFALSNRENGANFYGESSGIVELRLRTGYKLKIGNYEVPLSMVMMWNPQSDKAYMQLTAEVFSF
ncbi:MAG: hypothetical protein R3Y61_05310 [Rikenellaceae bacterium]